MNLISLEILSWVVFLLETKDRTRIPPGGKLVWDRAPIDWVYIWTNKIGTGVFNYHLFQYCWHSSRVYWRIEEMTIFNTVIAFFLLFVIYDLFYAQFHRLLHAPQIYGYVHKHHHKQRAPQYGNDDAINTHPIEFWVGAYLHLFAIWAIPVHIVPVLAFLILITLFSALNHTRFVFMLGKGYLYDNREHDTHHRLLTCNYAAYTQLWDVIFGTYVHWSNPSVDYLSYPRPAVPEYSTVAACKDAYAKAMALNDAPKRALVTGGCGLVGERLCSMLVQRGAELVICADIVDDTSVRGKAVRAEIKARHVALLKGDADKIRYEVADINDRAQMTKLMQGCDAVFNVAALVGPYYKHEQYDKVNHIGAIDVAEACKAAGVPRLVMTSSPSTRMQGTDIMNLTEDQLPKPFTFEPLQEYARTKTSGEQAVLAMNSKELSTICIGPHQVYGPADTLFLPSFMVTAKAGLLRVLGNGQNLISFTHTDNCAHAHILAYNAIASHTSKAAGKYYIVTDGGAQYMWGALDWAVRCAGYVSLLNRFNINTCLLYPAAYAALAFSKLTGKQLKLNPFVVKMVSMHRYFNIDRLRADVGYYPIRAFDEAWPETMEAVFKRMNIPYTPVEYPYADMKVRGLNVSGDEAAEADFKQVSAAQKKKTA
jgi:nucleoside-diphosphate-sugar epimerase/sterol desaturase/sphingolipid hydroxylase (fatty acid hydroxylase superfamily)